TERDVANYFKDGSLLKGLSDAHVPGVEVSSGSLVHGLSVGVGLALAAKRKGTGQRCFAVVGDGELNEGSIWERLLLAAHSKLSNVIVIVDQNRYQAMGPSREVMPLGRIADKFPSFGFEARVVDGHDEAAIDDILAELDQAPSDCPRALVAHTTKGKG